MYQLHNSEGVLACVKKDMGDGKVLLIPVAEANTDYQEYLAWLAEGNTPEPADD